MSLLDRFKKRKNFSVSFINFIGTLPLAVIAGLAGFSVVAIVLLLLGQFHAGLIWTIGSLVVLICMWSVLRFAKTNRPGTTKEQIICDVIILLGVLVWGGWNFMLTSQHLMTDRDPATYAVAGAWLSEHSNFVEQNTTTFQNINGFNPQSAGFWVNTESDTLYPQGQHLLPALLGAVGKVVGPTFMLHFNVVFGMTALLAVYCFGRLFLLPRWALLAAGVMSVSLPLLYFSRDTYTEPLTLTFIFGGLALLMIAQKTRSLWAWGLAGMTFGASILARVDAYLAVVGVMAFFVVYLALAERKDRLKRLAEVMMFTVPVAFMGILAWFDLKLYSPPYYQSLKGMLMMQIVAAVLVLVVGLAAWGIFTAKPKWRKQLDQSTKRWRAGAAAVLVLAAGLFFVAQPLWYEGEAIKPNGLVSEVQVDNGHEQENRSYTELAPQWVSWYIGPVLATLGVAGLAYATYRSMRDKKILLLCALFVVMGTTLVYFVRPSITPDQIWAARRMLPVVIPGVVIFGIYAMAELLPRIKFPHLLLKRAVLGTAVAALVLGPLLTSGPFLGERFLKQFAAVNSVCERLPENAIVVWLGLARMEMVQPTRAYCDFESYGYNFNDSDIPSQETLAQAAQAAKENGQILFVGMYSHQYKDVLLPSHQKAPREVNYITYSRIEPTLISAPYIVDKIGRGVTLAEVRTDGSVVPPPKKTE
jgi:hypothetical protein